MPGTQFRISSERGRAARPKSGKDAPNLESIWRIPERFERLELSKSRSARENGIGQWSIVSGQWSGQGGAELGWQGFSYLDGKRIEKTKKVRAFEVDPAPLNISQENQRRGGSQGPARLKNAPAPLNNGRN